MGNKNTSGTGSETDLGRSERDSSQYRQDAETAQLLRAGLQQHMAGALLEAENLYRQALAAAPGNAETKHLLGVIAYQKGKYDVAAQLIREAISAEPGLAGAYFTLGNVLACKGLFDAAIACYRQGISIDWNPDESSCIVAPDYADAHNNLGNMFAYQGRLTEAVASIRTAIALKPDFAGAYYNLGKVLEDVGARDEAATNYKQAIALEEDFAEAYCNLGNIACTARRYAEAAEHFHKAISIDPDLAEAYNGLAIVFAGQGRFDEAVENHKRSVALGPSRAESHLNLGGTLFQQRRLDEAVNCFQTALSLEPGCPEAEHSWSMACLLMGDLARGWQMYESRFRIKKNIGHYPDMPVPRWQGEPLAGKTLFVWAEQGLGDTIQFVRYLEKVKQPDCRILFSSPPSLRRLLYPLPFIDKLAGADEVASAHFHIPLMSLPAVLGTTLDTIPRNIPYIIPDKQLVAHWRGRLQVGDGINIGIAWTGNPENENNAYRSIPLQALVTPLVQLGVRVYSLQKDQGAVQIAALPENLRPIDMTADLHDFMDTAALIANLDLVIAVDTSVLHLAGAIGTPAWAVLSAMADWRWMLEREDSPWYPAMRLYRQATAYDWEPVLARLAADLKDLPYGA